MMVTLKHNPKVNPIPKGFKTLWEGNYLDGKLELQGQPDMIDDQYIITFRLKNHTSESTGSVLMQPSKFEDAGAMIDTALAAISEYYISQMAQELAAFKNAGNHAH